MRLVHLWWFLSWIYSVLFVQRGFNIRWVSHMNHRNEPNLSSYPCWVLLCLFRSKLLTDQTNSCMKLPDSLHLLPSTPRIKSMHTIIRYPLFLNHYKLILHWYFFLFSGTVTQAVTTSYSSLTVSLILLLSMLSHFFHSLYVTLPSFFFYQTNCSFSVCVMSRVH